MKGWFIPLTLAALSVTVADAAWAQDGAARALEVRAENLMAGDARHQERAAQGGLASDLLPGDVVRYELRFTNTTDVPVRNVVFDNPLPAGLRFVVGTASADPGILAVSYSIDGGQSFSAQPMVEMLVEGERRNVPAPAEMYTHIRWTVQGWVQPGAQVTAEYRAELPDAAFTQRGG